MNRRTRSCSAAGLLFLVVGPGFLPGGTGMIVTSGMTGGNGLSFGGQNPMVMVPKMGRVILMHSGLGARIGKMTFVGEDPSLLRTVVFDIRMLSTVWTGNMTTSVFPSREVVSGGGVQIDRVVDGGNSIVQGYEHDTV